MLEKNKVYNLSEFCKVLRESQQTKQEFKAKKGETVDREDKENNGKAVEDILKKTKEYDGGIQNNPKREACSIFVTDLSQMKNIRLT